MRMKKGRWIFLLALWIAFTAVPLPARAEEEGERMPLLSGMFVATELTTQGEPWNQEDWNSAVEQLKRVGMDRLVIQYSVQYYSQNNKVYYYRPGFEEAGADRGGRQNTLDYALNACRDQGMKIYLGLHLAEDLWFSAMDAGFRDVGTDGKSAFLTESASFSAQLFDDLQARYGTEYDDVIEGWYLPYEFNNTMGDAARNRLVEDFYQPLSAHIKKAAPDKKILISPLIYPPMLTEPTEAMLETWEKILYDVWTRSQVDIIAPQDGCGWESSVRENLPPYYEAMARACREAQSIRKRKGWGEASAWNNPELYSMTGSNTMTMKRFGGNMQLLDQYVDAHVSFSLHSLIELAPGKGGTNLTNGAFYQAYAYVAEHGCLYRAELPAPAGLTARTENTFDIRLSWERMGEEGLTLPVAGYRIRRSEAAGEEGILLPDVPQPAEEDGEVSFLDAQLESGRTYYYQVFAYDGCGNLSAVPAEIEVTVADDVFPVLRQTSTRPAADPAFRFFSLTGEPMVSGEAKTLKDGGEVRIGADGETPVRYVLECVCSEEIGLLCLQVRYSPGEGYFFPDKIEALADGVLVNTIYPQRDYGASPAGPVWLPVSLAGASAGEKAELVITQSRREFVLTGATAYGCDRNVKLPENYREPENLAEGLPVTVSGYTAVQGFSPEDHFRGTDSLLLDYEEGLLSLQQNLHKGNYATSLLTRGSADLPYVRWQEDGGGGITPGRPGDANRSIWFRTMDLKGESFDLTVELPTPQSIRGVSLELLSDRDSAVFLPLKVEFYGLTRGGGEELIGTALRPAQAQIDFDLPPSGENCHRQDSFRYKTLDGSGREYRKIIARVYPQYPANSHFMRGFCVY